MEKNCTVGWLQYHLVDHKMNLASPKNLTIQLIVFFVYIFHTNLHTLKLRVKRALVPWINLSCGPAEHGQTSLNPVPQIGSKTWALCYIFSTPHMYVDCVLYVFVNGVIAGHIGIRNVHCPLYNICYENGYNALVNHSNNLAAISKLQMSAVEYGTSFGGFPLATSHIDPLFASCITDISPLAT